MTCLILALACSDKSPTDTQPTDDTSALVDTQAGGDAGDSGGDGGDGGDGGESGDGGDGGTPWPSLAAIEDHSVNDASATHGTDPKRGDPAVLLATGSTSDNAKGAFHGSGTGNKAIAGLPGYDGKLLSDFSELDFDARTDDGTLELYLNLVLDLQCDGKDLRLLVVDEACFGEYAVGSDGSISVYLNAFGRNWKAVGGLDDLLPGHLEPDCGRLTDVSAAYPKACFRDADTGDGGMPAGVVTRAVMFLLGDSGNTTASTWYLTEVELDGDVWE